jgi:hypothetical protein
MPTSMLTILCSLYHPAEEPSRDPCRRRSADECQSGMRRCQLLCQKSHEPAARVLKVRIFLVFPTGAVRLLKK